MRTTLKIVLIAVLGTVGLQGQSSPSQKHKILLQADFSPGDEARYELEAAGSFLPVADWSGAILSPPRGPCDYAMSAIVNLRALAADKDGNTPVEARYTETRVTSVRCALFSSQDFQKRLSALQAEPVIFRVGPHGETEVKHDADGYFKYWDGAELLRKVTRDLLQTQFSSNPVAAGETWKPRGQFAYSRDHGLKSLELSGSDLRFRDLVPVDGRTCAWVTSQYVFSPVDLPAAGTVSGGRTIPGAGNNAVAAVLRISLLLDPQAHRVAWLHRSQTIDNKLTLASPYSGMENASDPEDSPDDDPQNPTPDLASRRSDRPGHYPLMTFHFQEEARARLLPDQSVAEWLAALKKFESTPQPETGTLPVPVTKSLLPNQVTQATKPELVKRTTRVIDSDGLVSTPLGFTRYEKQLCRDAWFCAAVSVGIPGEVQIPEDTPLHTIYLTHSANRELRVSLGPALDRHDAGLTEDEELQRQAGYYLTNYVWLASKPGIGTNVSSATLDGYPSILVEYSAAQRDMADIHGLLGLMLTPWGKIVPVSCSWDRGPSKDLQSLCEKIITSVSLRR